MIYNFKRKLKKGFTLLELAIVLLVLSFLVVGVLVGRQLIVQAKMTSIVFEIRQIQSRYDEFLGMYNFPPGDLSSEACWGVSAFSGVAGGFLCYNNTISSSYNGYTIGTSGSYFGGGYADTNKGHVNGYYLQYINGITSYYNGEKEIGVINTIYKTFYANWFFSLFNGSSITNEVYFDYTSASTSLKDISGNVFTTALRMLSVSGLQTFATIKWSSFFPKFSAGEYYWRFVGIHHDWEVDAACSEANGCQNTGYVNLTSTGAFGQGDQYGSAGNTYIQIAGVSYGTNATDGTWYPAFTVEESKMLKAKLDDPDNARYPVKGNVVFAPSGLTFNSTYAANDPIKVWGMSTDLFPGVSSSNGTNDWCVQNAVSTASWKDQNILWSRSDGKSSENRKRQECNLYFKLKRL